MTMSAPGVAIALVLYCALGSFGVRNQSSLTPSRQENKVPVVKINAPINQLGVALNTPAPFRIKVTDPEDGESAFGEIATNEVFLEVKVYPDSLAAAKAAGGNATEAPALTLIKGFDCLNCHAFSGKLIGPSFSDISRKYGAAAPLDSLAQRVRNGSVGKWGNIPMPSHPDLSGSDAREIVQWIVTNGAAPGVDYYRGTTGYFTLKQPSPGSVQAVYLLTASYLDHGLGGDPKTRRTGFDRVIVKAK